MLWPFYVSHRLTDQLLVNPEHVIAILSERSADRPIACKSWAFYPQFFVWAMSWPTSCLETLGILSLVSVSNQLTDQLLVNSWHVIAILCERSADWLADYCAGRDERHAAAAGGADLPQHAPREEAEKVRRRAGHGELWYTVMFCTVRGVFQNKCQKCYKIGYGIFIKIRIFKFWIF